MRIKKERDRKCPKVSSAEAEAISKRHYEDAIRRKQAKLEKQIQREKSLLDETKDMFVPKINSNKRGESMYNVSKITHASKEESQSVDLEMQIENVYDRLAKDAKRRTQGIPFPQGKSVGNSPSRKTMESEKLDKMLKLISPATKPYGTA